MKTNDKGKKLFREKLIFESFINSIPTILGITFWVFINYSMCEWIKSNFSNHTLYPIILMIFFFSISFPLIKIIPTPSLVYEEVLE
jgi:hypothetical protein